LVISWFYFFGCLFWVSVSGNHAPYGYVPMVLPVGRKYIEQFGFCSFPSQWQPGLNFFQLKKGRRQHPALNQFVVGVGFLPIVEPGLNDAMIGAPFRKAPF
jgi:hypothetical protein